MNERFAAIVENFEAAWHEQAAPPDLLEFVRESSTDRAVRDATWVELLEELVAIDMEWRWKRVRLGKAAPRSAWAYWRELSQVGATPTPPLSLIAEEYRARSHWGDEPAHSTIVNQLPEHASELRRLLSAVDLELAQEKDDGPCADHHSTQSVREVAFPIERLSEAPPVGETWANVAEYRLHQMLGAGANGRVYRATHLLSGRPAAVKYLRKALHSDRRAIERFLEEARIAARLKAPGIVAVRRVGLTPGAGCFLEMELLPGPDLSKVASTGVVEIADAIRWTIDAARALGYAHEAGIIHCDMKPGNLVLDAEGRACVTDFGLARTLDAHGNSAGNWVAGTVPFMAPEQVNPAWGRITRLTDVYGLGAVLYSLLAGLAPFAGATTGDIVAQVASAAVPLPLTNFRPDVSPDLAATVMRALSKKPDERFASATNLVDTLKSLLQTT